MPSFFYLQFPPQEHDGNSKEHHARGYCAEGGRYLINQTHRAKKLTGYIEGKARNNTRQNPRPHGHTTQRTKDK